MNKAGTAPDDLKSLRILQELSKDETLTQRDISSRLGIALGLVNSYIKNLIKKGHITIKSIPTKRYAYYITPKGFTEKTRLTFNLFNEYNRVYKEARAGLKKAFSEICDDGSKNVVFAGVDEVAEIAYLTLKETDMNLVAVLDNERIGDRFFEHIVKPYTALQALHYDSLIITSFTKRDRVQRELIKSGVKKADMLVIFQ